MYWTVANHKYYAKDGAAVVAPTPDGWIIGIRKKYKQLPGYTMIEGLVYQDSDSARQKAESILREKGTK